MSVILLFIKVSVFQKFIIFQNWHNFLSHPKDEYLPTMISGKNAAREPTAGVNEAKIYSIIAENCWYSCMKCDNTNIIQYFNISRIVFHIKSISGFHDFKQKSGQRTNSWSEGGKNLPKKWPKIVNIPIYNQIILQLFNWSKCIFTILCLLQIFITLKLFVKVLYICLHGKTVWRSKGFQDVP